MLSVFGISFTACKGCVFEYKRHKQLLQAAFIPYKTPTRRLDRLWKIDVAATDFVHVIKIVAFQIVLRKRKSRSVQLNMYMSFGSPPLRYDTTKLWSLHFHVSMRDKQKCGKWKENVTSKEPSLCWTTNEQMREAVMMMFAESCHSGCKNTKDSIFLMLMLPLWHTSVACVDMRALTHIMIP